MPVRRSSRLAKREMGLHLWYAVEFDDSVPVTRAASDMDASGDMELVSYVYSVKYADATIPFDDPKLPDQWHYMNFGDEDRRGCRFGHQPFPRMGNHHRTAGRNSRCNRWRS